MVTDFLIWDTRYWKNGINRTLLYNNEIDPYDKRLRVVGGSGRKFFCDGQGNGYLSGSQARINILASHFNGKLQGTFKLNSTISSFEQRLRSRHYMPGDVENRFGGYGVAISLTQAVFVRETYHDSYTTIATVSLSTQLVNGTEYPMEFSVVEDGLTVDLELKIDYGSGLTSVATGTDSDPPDYAETPELYEQRSYAWIRTNGTEPLDLKMREVKVINILT